MKKISDAVVDRLLKYMREQNLTQYKLSQQSGVPFATIKSIMQRRTNDVSLKTIIMLSDGLNISVNEFLNDESFNINNLLID
ncbi:MAG: helix-turn-helix transcriptional regulator [Clostridia bacterium]|nr:helix-turn-helix transcriptional regulator [Clostridia bacterium]